MVQESSQARISDSPISTRKHVEQGLGVLPDKRKALQWYSLAAIQQDEESTLAKEKVDELNNTFLKKRLY